MTEAERQDARQAAGPVPAKAFVAARESMASSSFQNPKAKAAPRPSTAPDAKSAKKPRRQGG